MTYFQILALFVGPPVALLGLLAWYGGRRKPVWAWGPLVGHAYVAVLVHVVIAVVYTTPWDNYLVATGVWWYDPELVLGLTLGWVPVEEYAFFVLQTLLSGLFLLALMRRTGPPAPARPAPRLRLGAVGIAALIWLVGLAILLAGWEPGTYLGLTLAWALIPVMTQLAFGADILWARRRLVLAAILIPTAYLTLADTVAIQSGTWTIDPAQSTGVLLGGILPVEEVVFFMLTNLLIVFGMTLMLAPESQARTPAPLQQVGAGPGRSVPTWAPVRYESRRQ